MRCKPARGDHGQDIRLSEEGEDGIRLDLPDGASEPNRAPALPDHGEHRAGRPEAEGEHTRVQIGFDVSSKQAGWLTGLAALLLHRRDLLKLVIQRVSIRRRIGCRHLRARVKDDARIDPIDDGLMTQDGDMNVVAALDQGVGGVDRHALRPARPEMRDHEEETLLRVSRARVCPQWRIRQAQIRRFGLGEA